jgi:hypothetical protein
LHKSTLELLPNAEFHFLSDLYGYDVAEQDVAVHKLMREVGPRFLAAHGFAVGFWQLYGAAPPAASRTGTCTRVAHVHRDCTKIARFNELLASPVERYFCDPGAAQAWLGRPIDSFGWVVPPGTTR